LRPGPVVKSPFSADHADQFTVGQLRGRLLEDQASSCWISDIGRSMGGVFEPAGSFNVQVEVCCQLGGEDQRRSPQPADENPVSVRRKCRGDDGMQGLRFDRTEWSRATTTDRLGLRKEEHVEPPG